MKTSKDLNTNSKSTEGGGTENKDGSSIPVIIANKTDPTGTTSDRSGRQHLSTRLHYEV